VATTLTHDDGVNHGFMFWVGVVEKAGAAMSEACRAAALPLSDASWIVLNEVTPSGPTGRELGLYGLVPLCHGNSIEHASRARLATAHAATTAARHCAAASARKIRNVDREMRWRCRLKVL